MRFVAAILTFWLGSLPTVDMADWQYTKWGMKVDQIARASDGQLHVPTRQEGEAKARNGIAPGLLGTYQTSTFRFTCELYFQSPTSGLTRVALTAIDYNQSNSIIESLRGLYGEPVEAERDKDGGKYRWRDEVHNNSIELYDTPMIRVFSVFYTPLRSGSEKGL
jgi:hypothetical protein